MSTVISCLSNILPMMPRVPLTLCVCVCVCSRPVCRVRSVSVSMRRCSCCCCRSCREETSGGGRRRGWRLYWLTHTHSWSCWEVTHTHTHTHSDSPLDLNHLNPNFLDQVWKSTLGFCWLPIIHRHMEVDVTGKIIITTTNHSSPSFNTCVMSSGRSS